NPGDISHGVHIADVASWRQLVFVRQKAAERSVNTPPIRHRDFVCLANMPGTDWRIGWLAYKLRPRCGINENLDRAPSRIHYFPDAVAHPPFMEHQPGAGS